jgi:zinc protease
MVVVGDVAAQKVEQLARKYLEPIPSHQTFSEPRTKEPEQAGERVVTIRKEAELPLLMMAFHMPESRNADMPAIQLAETLLSTGNSSRLHTRLVDHDQLALNVQVFDEPSLNPYILGVLVQPRAGAAMDALRSALTEELERLGSTPVPEPELRKAKNQWLAAHYRELKTVAGRANQIGSYEVFHGNYARLYSEPADVEKVTAADLQRVSKDLFRSTNRTVAILEPEHAGTKVTRR